MISLIRSLVLLVRTSFSGIFDFHQVVHKIGEIKHVKVDPLELFNRNPRQSGLLAPKPICN
ncbi:hypothetical protein BANRA_05291 [Klebsiella pneumoniae]|nr:hypothetical protein BANRA_05291 [Klebsiella pneumoniae]